MGKNNNFGADFTDFVGEVVQKQTHFFAKKHVLSPCLGTSPWVGWFGCRVHAKNNGSICITLATMVGKGLKQQFQHIQGFQCTHLGEKLRVKPMPQSQFYVQIPHR